MSGKKGFFSCPKCGKIYRLRSAYEKHFGQCAETYCVLRIDCRGWPSLDNWHVIQGNRHFYNEPAPELNMLRFERHVFKKNGKLFREDVDASVWVKETEADGKLRELAEHVASELGAGPSLRANIFGTVEELLKLPCHPKTGAREI